MLLMASLGDPSLPCASMQPPMHNLQGLAVELVSLEQPGREPGLALHLVRRHASMSARSNLLNAMLSPR